MKIVKKIVISISVFVILIQNKCYAQILYGPPKIEPTNPSKKIGQSIFGFILNMLKKVCIPIILLIGVIIYLKKSKISKNKKILIGTGLIIVIAILYKAFVY